MAVLKKTNAKVRVQMEFSDSSIERLRELKRKTEATSYSDVAKHAFRLYELMIELKEAEETFLIQDKEGNTRQLELFIP